MVAKLRIVKEIPAQIAHRPVPLARKDAPVLEHEGVHLLLVDPERLDRSRPSANDISHGFMASTGIHTAAFGTSGSAFH
jgi:hypothetical protein